MYLEHDFQPYQPPDGKSWHSLKHGIQEWDSLFYAPIYARQAHQADGQHPPGSSSSPAAAASSSASSSSAPLGSVSDASQVTCLLLTCCPWVRVRVRVRVRVGLGLRVGAGSRAELHLHFHTASRDPPWPQDSRPPNDPLSPTRSPAKPPARRQESSLLTLTRGASGTICKIGASSTFCLGR